MSVLVRDTQGNIYATCPDSLPGSECRHVMVSPRAYRLEEEVVRPPADLHGPGLAMWMIAEQPWLDRRPVAKCHQHGVPLRAWSLS